MTTSDLLASERRTAVLCQAVAVGLATGLYGVSFGALSIAVGLGFWTMMALSLLLFSGGFQFAFVGVVGAGGAPAVAVATSTLLGVRNGLYGMQVARWLHASGLRRLVGVQLIIDESTVVGLAQSESAARRYGFWTTGIAVYACWNVMIAVGALVGDRLGDPRRYGLDAMVAGVFVALLWLRLRAREPQVVALVAALVAVLGVSVFSAGLSVLAAGVVAVVAVVVGYRCVQIRSAWRDGVGA